MPRLKNRQKQIPNGFRFTDPVTKWRARPFTSFHSIVDQLITARTGNPALAEKHGWKMDRASVEDEVDSFNALICQKMEWWDFIEGGEAGGSAVPFRGRTPIQLPSNRANAGVVAGVKNIGAGIGLVVDWIGEDLMPVAIEEAERRASICAISTNPPDNDGKIKLGCPQNQDPNFLQKLSGAAAEEIRLLIGVKNNLELATRYDDKLHTCQACECYLKLKVWSPLDLILKRTSEETKAKLDPRCWILR